MKPTHTMLAVLVMAVWASNIVAARIAAAESLRTIEVQEDLNAGLTPEFLNLKFNRQESLATAELREIQALVDYQIALSELYNSMGIALERNNIEFVVPDADDD